MASEGGFHGSRRRESEGWDERAHTPLGITVGRVLYTLRMLDSKRRCAPGGIRVKVGQPATGTQGRRTGGIAEWRAAGKVVDGGRWCSQGRRRQRGGYSRRRAAGAVKDERGEGEGNVMCCAAWAGSGLRRWMDGKPQIFSR